MPAIPEPFAARPLPPEGPLVLFTGFPGFLGARLLERLLERTDPQTRFACLVQPAYRAQAEARAREIEAAGPRREGRILLVEGDITAPGLGLGEAGEELRERTVEVYHLAAVYTLSVERALAERVNVEGTARVLDFAAACPRLRRLHYVSTCYVSGRYPGRFTEEMLEEGQRFNNHYEETKYRAEVAVQRAMRRGLPATIYRPAITVGDSRTGATQKYDGPYAAIRWVLRWPLVAPFPVAGDIHHTELNVVPVDFIVGAIAYLSGLEASEGVVYQLADPAPSTVAQVLDGIGRATGRYVLPVPLPLGATVAALEGIPGLEALTGIEGQSLPYLSHPARYATEHAERDLAGSGIVCPSLLGYLERLVAFVLAHPEITSRPMV